MQDALVQISSLSNRLQRERAVAAAAATLGSGESNIRDGGSPGPLNGSALNTVSAAGLDNYLDYFDEPEPHNSSELDDIIAEEQQSRFPQELPSHNDIKSECEDAVEDFEDHTGSLTRGRDLDEEEDEEDFEDSLTQGDESDPQLQRLRGSYSDVSTMRSMVLNSMHSNQSASAPNRHHLRLQHLNRLQTRSYHEDLRAKRPRSQENISSSSNLAPIRSAGMHPNVSFVRPTFSKPPVSSSINSDTVSTSSNSNMAHSLSHSLTPSAPLDTELVAASSNNSTRRLEVVNNLNPSTLSSNSELAASTSPSQTTAPPHVELCDCKSDPDAMFLMSLLPDIQKLNGRDRGKIKIAFQHILQDYLYPD